MSDDVGAEVAAVAEVLRTAYLGPPRPDAHERAARAFAPLIAAAKAEVLDRLADDWRLLKVHHPVGAYLPIGQLDGDCKCGSGAWPCATVRAALDSKAGDPNGN